MISSQNIAADHVVARLTQASLRCSSCLRLTLQLIIDDSEDERLDEEDKETNDGGENDYGDDEEHRRAKVLLL